jgi:hypothetical protein
MHTLSFYLLWYISRMKFHFWHTFLSLFFAGLVVLGLAWLDSEGRLAAFIPLSDFFLMALATFRLIHLFTYDNITAFIREWFVGFEATSFAGTLGHLVNCPWCTGLWFSFIVVFAYFGTPYAWYLILILALSSLATFLQILTSRIGGGSEASHSHSANSVPSTNMCYTCGR